MENKNGRSGMEANVIYMLKSLLCSYIVTAVLLLVLTVLLYRTGLSEANVNAGITISYAVATFAGGFIAGRLKGRRKFVWGMLSGILYFILLVLISLGLYRTLQADVPELITTFLLCAGGGMLGGMIS